MYGLKYISHFDNLITNEIYQLKISEREYSGAITELTLAGDGVIHSYSDSDPLEPITGSSLQMSFVSDGISIDDFISNDDFRFKVELFGNAGTLFIGWLSQDDFSESVDTFRHTINLTATDGLGLLKNRKLNESERFVDSANYITNATINVDRGNKIFSFSHPFAGAPNVRPGDRIVITGTSEVDGEYTVVGFSQTLLTWSFKVVEYIPGSSPTQIGSLYSRSLPDLYNLFEIREIIMICLSVTNMSLEYDVRSFFTSKGSSDISLFSCLLDCKSFLTSDTEFETCYDVLTKILLSFNCSIYQSGGKWCITGRSEQSAAGIIFHYDDNFQNATLGVVAVTKDPVFASGTERSVLRAADSIEYKFTYESPRQLVRNINLLEIGNLLRTETEMRDGETFTLKVYKQRWFNVKTYPSLSPAEDIITIVYDSDGNEVERYLETRNVDLWTIPFIVSKDDAFKFNVELSTSKHNIAVGNYVFGFNLLGQNNKYSLSNLTNGLIKSWDSNNAEDWFLQHWWTNQKPAGQDSFDSVGVEVHSNLRGFPEDGQFSFYIPATGDNFPAGRIRYKNFSFQFIHRINNTTQVIGHIHTDEKQIRSLNHIQKDMSIDSVPKYQISGGLWRDSSTRADLFQLNTRRVRFGEKVAYNEMRWRGKIRNIFEGTVTELFRFNDAIQIDKKFYYPTSAEINYRNNIVNCKLVEFTSTSEGVVSKYDFKYLYESSR